ncbi:MAG: hypothetical protein WDW36_007204 [Sanguina aurantia]
MHTTRTRPHPKARGGGGDSGRAETADTAHTCAPLLFVSHAAGRGHAVGPAGDQRWRAHDSRPCGAGRHVTKDNVEDGCDSLIAGDRTTQPGWWEARPAADRSLASLMHLLLRNSSVALGLARGAVALPNFPALIRAESGGGVSLVWHDGDGLARGAVALPNFPALIRAESGGGVSLVPGMTGTVGDLPRSGPAAALLCLPRPAFPLQTGLARGAVAPNFPALIRAESGGGVSLSPVPPDLPRSGPAAALLCLLDRPFTSKQASRMEPQDPNFRALIRAESGGGVSLVRHNGTVGEPRPPRPTPLGPRRRRYCASLDRPFTSKQASRMEPQDPNFRALIRAESVGGVSLVRHNGTVGEPRPARPTPLGPRRRRYCASLDRPFTSKQASRMEPQDPNFRALIRAESVGGVSLVRHNGTVGEPRPARPTPLGPRRRRYCASLDRPFTSKQASRMEPQDPNFRALIRAESVGGVSLVRHNGTVGEPRPARPTPLGPRRRRYCASLDRPFTSKQASRMEPQDPNFRALIRAESVGGVSLVRHNGTVGEPRPARPTPLGPRRRRYCASLDRPFTSKQASRMEPQDPNFRALIRAESVGGVSLVRHNGTVGEPRPARPTPLGPRRRRYCASLDRPFTSKQASRMEPQDPNFRALIRAESVGGVSLVRHNGTVGEPRPARPTPLGPRRRRYCASLDRPFTSKQASRMEPQDPNFRALIRAESVGGVSLVRHNGTVGEPRPARPTPLGPRRRRCCASLDRPFTSKQASRMEPQDPNFRALIRAESVGGVSLVRHNGTSPVPPDLPRSGPAAARCCASLDRPFTSKQASRMEPQDPNFRALIRAESVGGVSLVRHNGTLPDRGMRSGQPVTKDGVPTPALRALAARSRAIKPSCLQSPVPPDLPRGRRRCCACLDRPFPSTQASRVEPLPPNFPALIRAESGGGVSLVWHDGDALARQAAKRSKERSAAPTRPSSQPSQSGSAAPPPPPSQPSQSGSAAPPPPPSQPSQSGSAAPPPPPSQPSQSGSAAPPPPPSQPSQSGSAAPPPLPSQPSQSGSAAPPPLPSQPSQSGSAAPPPLPSQPSQSGSAAPPPPPSQPSQSGSAAPPPLPSQPSQSGSAAPPPPPSQPSQSGSAAPPLFPPSPVPERLCCPTPPPSQPSQSGSAAPPPLPSQPSQSGSAAPPPPPSQPSQSGSAAPPPLPSQPSHSGSAAPPPPPSQPSQSGSAAPPLFPPSLTVNLPASEGGGTRELRVRYLLSCDAKFASLYFSHQGSAATFFCIWCTISKDELLAAMETGDEAPARRARLAVDAAELFEHTRALEETVAAAAANAAPATTAQSSLPSPAATAQSSLPAPATTAQSSLPSPAATAQSSLPSPAATAQSSLPSPATTAQSSLPSPAATAQSSLPAPVTPTQSSLPSAASSSGIRLAAVRVAAAGAAELLKSYTLRTRAAMEEVGNKVSPYLNKPGSATLFDTARLLREYEAGTTATLAAAIECHVIKAQGRTKTRALSHVSKGLDMYRQSITAAPLSNVITIEDYRIEPLHAVINCINNLWELTEAFYEQLIGHYKGAWAAIMAEIGLHQHITNFNGKECQAVVDRRGEFLQHLSLHPMCGVLGRVWALMAILLWSLNVADMEQHTLAHFATYAAAADQLEYYISKYLSKPYPSPEQHDLSVFSPTCGTKEHPLVSMSVKQYDHALMHHALPMYIAEDVSIASAGSSWLEAGNSGWKDGLNFHTSGGGGWERERKDQMRQLPDRGMRSGQPVTKDGVQRLPPCGAGRHVGKDNASRVEPLPPNFPALIRAESGGGVSLVWHDGDGGRTEQDAHHRTRPHPKARGGGGDSGRAETAAQLTHAPRSSLSPQLPDRGMRSGQPVTKDGVQRLPPCGAGRHVGKDNVEDGCFSYRLWLVHGLRQPASLPPGPLRGSRAIKPSCLQSPVPPRDLPRRRRCCACLDRPFPSTQASRVEPLPPNFPALIRAESGGGVSLVWHDGDGGRQEGVGGDSGRAETAAQLTHAPRSSLSPHLPDRGMRSGQPVTKDGVQRLPPRGAGRHVRKDNVEDGWSRAIKPSCLRSPVPPDLPRRRRCCACLDRPFPSTQASRVEPLPPNFPALIRAESGGGVSLVWHDGDGGRQEGVGGDSGRAETAAQLTHAPRSSLSPQLPDRGMRSGQPVTKDGVQRLPPCGGRAAQPRPPDPTPQRRCCACLDRPFPSTQASRVEPLPPNFPALIRAESGGGVSLVWHDGDGGRQEGVGGDSGRAETAAQLTHAPRSSLSPQLPDRGMRSGQPVTKDGVQRLPPRGAGRHVGKTTAPSPQTYPAAAALLCLPRPAFPLHTGLARGAVAAQLPGADPCGERRRGLPGFGMTGTVGGRSKMHTTGLAHTQRQEGVGGDSGRAETAAQLTHAPRSSLSPQLPDRGMRSGQPVTKDGVQRLPPLRGRAARFSYRLWLVHGLRQPASPPPGPPRVPCDQTLVPASPVPPDLPRRRRCCACLDRPFPSTQASRVEPLPPNFPALIRAESGGGVSLVWHDGDGGRQEGVGGDSGRAETAAQLTHAPRSSLSPQLPDRGMRSGQPVTKDGVQRLPPCGAGRHASRVEPLPPNFPALIRAESGGGVSLVWHDGDGGRQEGVGGDSGRAETAAQLTHAPRSSLSPQLPDRGMRSGQPVTKDGVQRLPPPRGRAAQPRPPDLPRRRRCCACLDRPFPSTQASRVEPLPPNFPALIRAESGGGVSLVWHDGDGGRTEQDAHHRTRPHPKARGGGGDSGRAETAAQLTHAPRSSLSPQLPDRGMRSGQPVTKDGVQRLPPCGAGRHSPVPPDLPRRRRCCACLDRPFPSTQASRVEPLPPNFPALIRAESGGGVSLVWHDGDGGRQEGVGGDSGRAETAAQLTHAPRSSLSPQLPDRGMRSGQPVTKDGVQRLPPCGAGRHASRVEPLPPNFPALIRAESGGGVSLVWHDGDGGRTEQDAHHRTRPHPKARGGGGDSGRAETAAQLTHAPRSSLSPQLPDRGMRSGQPVTKDGVQRLPPAGPGGTSGKTTWRMAVTVDRGRQDHAAGMSPVPPDLPRRRRCCACLDRPFPSTQASRVEPLPPNFPALIRAESGGGVSLVWHDGDGGRQEGVGGDSGRAETAAQLTHAPRSSLSPQLPDRGMRSGQPVTKDGVQRLPPLRGRAARSRAIKPSCLQSPVPPDLPRRRRCCACLDRPFPSTQASRVEPLPPNFPALIRAESGGGVSLVWHDGDGGRQEGVGGDSGRAETAAQLTHAPRSSLSPQLPDRGMRSGQPVTKDGVQRLPPCGAGRHVRKDNVEDGCDC